MNSKSLEEFFESRSFQEFYFFAIALVLAFGTLQTTGTLLETDRPVVTVTSCSMYPSLNVGDILVLHGTEYENLKEEDIVVYNAPASAGMNIPVVHRIIDKREDSLSTQGDNNPGQLDFEDDVNSDQIHGKMIFSVPRIGAVKLLAMDLTGIGAVNTDQPNKIVSLENEYFCNERS